MLPLSGKHVFFPEFSEQKIWIRLELSEHVPTVKLRIFSALEQSQFHEFDADKLEMGSPKPRIYQKPP